ncbi:MAG: enoyl-CoA hydratase/isomerase family protein, partial [Candidatus Jordarchaeum sp.]|uniref:enoyl-CoA hydratase/isomerase family protein n=1 Tax=Candidatus Jordarchaeum sp. TaxID=2823881 RepID=UPI0040497690
NRTPFRRCPKWVSFGQRSPLALAMSKKLIHEGFRKTFDEMIVKEVQYQAKLYASEDHREAAMSFLEKRKPVFKGK